MKRAVPSHSAVQVTARFIVASAPGTGRIPVLPFGPGPMGWPPERGSRPRRGAHGPHRPASRKKRKQKQSRKNQQQQQQSFAWIAPDSSAIIIKVFETETRQRMRFFH